MEERRPLMPRDLRCVRSRLFREPVARIAAGRPAGPARPPRGRPPAAPGQRSEGPHPAVGGGLARAAADRPLPPRPRRRSLRAGPQLHGLPPRRRGRRPDADPPLLRPLAGPPRDGGPAAGPRRDDGRVHRRLPREPRRAAPPPRRGSRPRPRDPARRGRMAGNAAGPRRGRRPHRGRGAAPRPAAPRCAPTAAASSTAPPA